MTERRMQLEDWLDDLCVRFIINLPEEDLSSVARICFQVEEAQWFYEDFIRPLDPTLPSMSLRSFCLRIFQHCPLLSAFSADNHMRAFEEFMLYKTRVPVRGAIMLNHDMDAAVLVKGWKKGANWSFPRGKINKDEDDLDCAVREVWEETGFDIKAAGLVPKGEKAKYIEIAMREQHMRLYVFRDVPMNTHFEPRTRKEISKIQWYRLSELPAFRKKGQQGQDGAEAAVNANKFYMVAPFLVPLKKWVTQQKKIDAQRIANNPHLGLSHHDDVATEEESGIDRGYAYTSESAQERMPPSVPALDTMAGATAALHRLLKIQPPTQGLQPEAAVAAPLPSSKDNVGEALLAFLSQSRPLQTIPLQTPKESIIYNPPNPNTPHHQHPHHPSSFFSQPPPPFPLQPLHEHRVDNSRRPYQPQNMGPSMSQHNIPQNFNDFQQNYSRFQAQQLQHPQPLPPAVPKAVFTATDGQIHGPMVSQMPSYSQPSGSHPRDQSLANPQFPNLHVPVIPSTVKQEVPRLTSHSLALLNAFKTRDDEPIVPKQSTNLPPVRGSKEHSQVPQSQSTLAKGFDMHVEDSVSTSNTATIPSANIAKPRVSDPHRSSLLNIFMSPNPQPTPKSIVSPNTQEVLRETSVPKAPQQGGSKTHTGPKSLHNTRSPIPSNEVVEEVPFRPVAILARPQTGKKELLPKLDSRNRENGPPSAFSGLSLQDKSSAVNRAGKVQAIPQGTEDTASTFQPQILKRPSKSATQSTTQTTTESTTTTATLHTSAIPVITAQNMVGRRPSQPVEHKQALLSLFGKAPVKPFPLPNSPEMNLGTPERPPFVGQEGSVRSIVGSIASGGDTVSDKSRQNSQTPISLADKGFLLGYLNSVAKGSGH